MTTLTMLWKQLSSSLPWLVLSVDYTGLLTTDHYSNKAGAADAADSFTLVKQRLQECDSEIHILQCLISFVAEKNHV